MFHLQLSEDTAISRSCCLHLACVVFAGSLCCHSMATIIARLVVKQRPRSVPVLSTFVRSSNVSLTGTHDYTKCSTDGQFRANMDVDLTLPWNLGFLAFIRCS